MERREVLVDAITGCKTVRAGGPGGRDHRAAGRGAEPRRLPARHPRPRPAAAARRRRRSAIRRGQRSVTVLRDSGKGRAESKGRKVGAARGLGRPGSGAGLAAALGEVAVGWEGVRGLPAVGGAGLGEALDLADAPSQRPGLVPAGRRAAPGQRLERSRAPRRMRSTRRGRRLLSSSHQGALVAQTSAERAAMGHRCSGPIACRAPSLGWGGVGQHRWWAALRWAAGNSEGAGRGGAPGEGAYEDGAAGLGGHDVGGALGVVGRSCGRMGRRSGVRGAVGRHGCDFGREFQAGLTRRIMDRVGCGHAVSFIIIILVY